MPRPPRNIAPDVCYHVMNRGNEKQQIFHKPADYVAFIAILTEALARHDIELFCWCLMPNHWHLVLRPRRSDSLAKFMKWLTVTHVRRHHSHFQSNGGHLYQGRYKSFPVEDDKYFIALCRYIEANALRAKLVDRAEKWRWSSLYQRITHQASPQLSDWPIDRPRSWIHLVNAALPEIAEKEIRASIQRERPLGSWAWIQRMVKRLGLEQTLRTRGRPQKLLSQLSTRQKQRLAKMRQKGV